MTGLVVLGSLLAYIAVGVGIVVVVKGKWRLLAVAAFVLIPTWDIIPGKIALAHYCDKEGGLRIYRSVEEVEGFLSIDGRAYKEYFNQYGYKYIETATERRDPRTGEVGAIEYARVTLDADGKLRREPIASPISKYEFRDYRNFDTYVSPWGITLFSASIVNRQTGETIAVDKRFGWYGGWIRQFNRPLLGSGDGCDGVNGSYADIVLRTLVPVRGMTRRGQRG